jgi:hypothetical protein
VVSLHTGRFAALALSVAAAVAGCGEERKTCDGGLVGERLTVVETTPALHAIDARVDGPYSIRFDRPVARDSIDDNSFRVFGRWTGVVGGDFSFSADDCEVSFTPERASSAGDWTWLNLSHHVEAKDGTSLRDAGFAMTFWTGVAESGFEFSEVVRHSTRSSPDEGTRAYGGVATDLNEDGFLDLTIVNEDTADLRVFMNPGDGTLEFPSFLEPTTPIGGKGSPSEPADFDHDGHADIVVANVWGNTISILFGRGDGTFEDHTEIPVGSQPRGVAVLDVDGDADMDIVNTAAVDSSMSLVLNRGDREFSAPGSFDAGGDGEWGLASADFDGDGIADLIVGAQDSEEILVHHGNGDGSFSPLAQQDASGRAWQVVVGDLNGDGRLDVTTALGSTGGGSVLLANREGRLRPPDYYTADGLTLATDVADLDGDGDLDWVVSTSEKDWHIYENDGTGVFQLLESVPATEAGSCAIAFDADNDGDLDLALVDEVADEVLFLRND